MRFSLTSVGTNFPGRVMKMKHLSSRKTHQERILEVVQVLSRALASAMMVTIKADTCSNMLSFE